MRSRARTRRFRHTIDVDLYRRSGELSDAEQALRAASEVDLGDCFRFELSLAEPIAQGGRAVRVPVVAYLGVTEFARFHVDLVTARRPDRLAARQRYQSFFDATYGQLDGDFAFEDSDCGHRISFASAAPRESVGVRLVSACGQAT